MAKDERKRERERESSKVVTNGRILDAVKNFDPLTCQ